MILLPVNKSKQNESYDDNDRALGHHADETVKRLFLSFDIHFAVLVV